MPSYHILIVDKMLSVDVPISKPGPDRKEKGRERRGRCKNTGAAREAGERREGGQDIMNGPPGSNEI